MNVIKINIFHMTKITNPSDWCFDSGATLHVRNYEAQFKTYEEFSIELRYLWTSTIRQKFMESVLLKWNWVLARSSLNQHYIFMYLISRKTNLLFKNGLVQEWDISRQWICYYLSVIYQYVLVLLILLILYLWHARLRLLNFKFLKFMSKHDIIYISMMIWIEWCIN